MALAIYDANGCFYVQIPASAFSLIQAAAANPVQLPVGPAQNGHGPTTPVVYTVEGWAFHHFAQGLETVEKQARATAQQALVKQAVSAGATAAAPITTLRTTISQAELAAAQQQQLNQAAQVAPSPQAAQQ